MIKRFLSSQLRINMASGVATTAINAVVMVIAYPIYLYFLGYEKYGVWLVLATVLTFTQLGDIGISQAIMKLVAEDYGRKDIQGIQQYVTTALTILSITGLIVLTAILVFKTQIIALFKLNNENTEMAEWLLPYIGILSLYVLMVYALNATLSGLGRMDLANYIQSIGKISAVTITSILLYNGRGIESLLIGNTISYVFIQVSSLICIRRIAHIRLLKIGNLDIQRGRRILRFGSVMFGASVINMLFSPFNKLMLSRYAGVSVIPVYEIAFTGSMYVKAFIQTGLRALLPEISRISGDVTVKTKNRILQLNRHAMKIIFHFGIPVYVVLIVLAPILLKIWLRDRCVATMPVTFQIMLVGSLSSLLCVPAYYTLMGLGRVHYCFLSQVIQGIVNAGIVGVILIFVGTVSIHSIALTVVLAMSATTFYLILKNRYVMQNYQHSEFDRTYAVSSPQSSCSEI